MCTHCPCEGSEAVQGSRRDCKHGRRLLSHVHVRSSPAELVARLLHNNSISWDDHQCYHTSRTHSQVFAVQSITQP